MAAFDDRGMLANCPRCVSNRSVRWKRRWLRRAGVRPRSKFAEGRVLLLTCRCNPKRTLPVSFDDRAAAQPIGGPRLVSERLAICSDLGQVPVCSGSGEPRGKTGGMAAAADRPNILQSELYGLSDAND